MYYYLITLDFGLYLSGRFIPVILRWKKDRESLS